jgi:hypothetical protein
LPESGGRRRLFRGAAVVVAAGSATWMIVQAMRGYFDLWAPLGVAISVLSLIGDAAERRRQRSLPGPSVNELAAALADILDRKCRSSRNRASSPWPGPRWRRGLRVYGWTSPGPSSGSGSASRPRRSGWPSCSATTRPDG